MLTDKEGENRGARSDETREDNSYVFVGKGNFYTFFKCGLVYIPDIVCTICPGNHMLA